LSSKKLGKSAISRGTATAAVITIILIAVVVGVTVLSFSPPHSSTTSNRNSRESATSSSGGTSEGTESTPIIRTAHSSRTALSNGGSTGQSSTQSSTNQSTNSGSTTTSVSSTEHSSSSSSYPSASTSSTTSVQTNSTSLYQGYPLCANSSDSPVGNSQVQSNKVVATIFNTTSPDGIYAPSTFFASGLYWAFFSNSTGTFYSTSPDGANWNTPTLFGKAETPSTVYFDGVHVHYAYSNISSAYYGFTNMTLCYRLGAPMANGTVEWLTPTQSIYHTNYYNQFGGFWGATLLISQIRVDSTFHPWILTSVQAQYDHQTDNNFTVIRSQSNNETFVMSRGFPRSLGNGYSGGYNLAYWSGGVVQADVVPLSQNRVATIVCTEPPGANASSIGSYLLSWNGQGWDGGSISLPMSCGNNPPVGNYTMSPFPNSSSILAATPTVAGNNSAVVNLLYATHGCTLCLALADNNASQKDVSNLSGITFDYQTGQVTIRNILADAPTALNGDALFANNTFYNSTTVFWTNGSAIYYSAWNSTTLAWSSPKIVLAMGNQSSIEEFQITTSQGGSGFGMIYLTTTLATAKNPQDTFSLKYYTFTLVNGNVSSSS